MLIKLSLFKELHTFCKKNLSLLLYLLRQFINQIHIPAFIGFEEGEVVAGAFAFADVGNAADAVGFVFFAHGEQGGV